MADAESTWTRPLFADLTADSTREEVLAAVEESEARSARVVDPSDFVGCGRQGQSRLDTDPVLQRQMVAGEEDQSAPGWEQGA